MANITANIPASLSFLSRAAKAVGESVTRFFTTVINASDIARQVNDLSALTDKELEAMGTTRQEQVQRIFAGRYFI